MTLKEFRNQNKLTISEASKASGVPVRTYIRYEQDEDYGSFLKRNAIMDALINEYGVSEDKGVLSVDVIRQCCKDIFEKYPDVEFCYLFGSYAKGYASDRSDVDLLISADITGLKFVGLIEELREQLHKKIDLIRLSDITENIDLLKEVMKDGLKIYG